jgi:hypothetical protein
MARRLHRLRIGTRPPRLRVASMYIYKEAKKKKKQQRDVSHSFGIPTEEQL